MSKLLAEWFWTDRWVGSSAFLLPIEPRGLYREMLTQAWRRGAKLPNDHEAIRRAVGCTRAEWKRCWPRIEHYWRTDGADLVNDTQVEVWQETVAAQQRASARGRKGAQARAQAPTQAVLEHKPPSPSPSPSPEPTLSKNESVGVPPARATSIGAGLLKPHGNVAFDSPRVYVKWKQHFEFVGFRNNPNAEQELQAFYQRVSDAWNTGSHANDSPGADMFAFWRDRYNEAWPAAPIAESKSRLPKWAQS